ncbi:MAG: hypothetical protein JWN21_671 [Sphingomonas bacterium]|nr:hypothetical protein [Sphingomonas bacterium]
MGEHAVTRATFVALAVCAFVALTCILLSLNRGLELGDESAYIYLLHHPDVVMQFVDYRLWGAFGGSVTFYRVLPLVLTTASAAFVAAGAVRSLDLNRREAVFVHLATLVGALGYFSVIRPTMNYGTTGLVFGNLFMGLLLNDLARAPSRGWPLILSVLLGVSLSLIALGRFTAVPAYVVILMAYAALRPGPPATRVVLVVATLLATMAAVAVLQARSLAITDMITFGTSLASASHRPSAFVPRDLLLIALMAVAGLAGAVAVLLAARLGLSSSWAAVAFVAFVLAAAVIDQRAVLAATDPGPSPFETNVNLYGTTYGFYIAAAFFAALMAFDAICEGRRAWQREGRSWGVVVLLGLACALPFLGTNTGILARSGLNAGPLFTATAVLALTVARRGVLANWAGSACVIGVAALAALWVFLNTVWSPYGVNGGWSRQTVRLDSPASVAGLRVSAGTAALATELQEGLAMLGYDRTLDRLLTGYGKPGLAVLADGTTVTPPFLYDYPGMTVVICDMVTRGVQSMRPRRLYGLNIDFRPELRRCLAERGINLAPSRVHRVSKRLTINIVPISRSLLRSPASWHPGGGHARARR